MNAPYARRKDRVDAGCGRAPTSPRSLLEMLVRLDVVRGPYQCETGMASAIVTRRERLADDRRNFMLIFVHRIVNDFVDS